MLNACMRSGRWACQAVLTLFLVIPPLLAQQSLDLPDATAEGFSPTPVTVTLTNEAPVQGYVLAIGYDPFLLNAIDVTVDGTAASAVGAEFIVIGLIEGGLTCAVVLDFEPPFDGQEIPSGSNQSVGVITLSAVSAVTENTDTPIDFVDGVFNDPPLSNVIVQGGLSVGTEAGLLLNGGTVTLTPPTANELIIDDGFADGDAVHTGDAQILMTNSTGDVQGFVLAIEHDPTDIVLEEVLIDNTITESVGAEFVIPRIYSSGGTLGVVLDFNSPFEDQVIPVGDRHHIATYRYRCTDTVYEPEPDHVTPLTFVDGVFGSPPLDNVIVIEGFSIYPTLINGTFTCMAIPPPPPEDTVLCMYPEFDGDNPDEAYPGQRGKLCFCYTDEDDNIQGMTITACYDCDLTVHAGTFDITGTILDELGADFVNHQVDDDCSDGEMGEIVIGILLDALPPFGDDYLPTTSVPLTLGCIDVTVEDTVPCEVTVPIVFCDNIDGNGNVNLYNNIIIDHQSIQDYERIGTEITTIPVKLFQRGDCNDDEKVDLADASAILAWEFLGFEIACHDACDTNDDGLINLADSVYTLNWLFNFGPIPPDPGPFDFGVDPTEDELPTCGNLLTTCD